MLEVNLSSFFGSSRKGLFKSVRILEKLDSGFWKVRTSDGVFKVFSDGKLKTGETVRGMLSQKGNLLKLEILNQESLRVSPDFFYPDSLRQTDILIKTAARLNFKVTEKEIYIIKKILRKKGKGRYLFTILLDAVDKGFKEEEQLSALTDSFNRHHNKERGRERMVKYLRRRVEEAENGDTPLFLYNHIRNRNSSWSVFPFSLGEAGGVEGAVRFRISGEKVVTIIVNAVVGRSGNEWGFFIRPEKDIYKMKIFCTEAEKVKESESFAKFRKKLQNLRVEIDDNVGDIVFFSNFDDKGNVDLDVTV